MSRPIRICKLCNKEYTPTRHNQKFCSISCASKSHPSGRKGKTNSLEHRRKLQEGLEKAQKNNSDWKYTKGEKHHSYLDGRSKNPEYRNWQKNQWHHRNRNAQGLHTFGEWDNLKAQYNWTCPCCKKKEPEIKLTLDHIIPLSRGGSNNIENIQPLCKSCNCKKSSKTIKY